MEKLVSFWYSRWCVGSATAAVTGAWRRNSPEKVETCFYPHTAISLSHREVMKNHRKVLRTFAIKSTKIRNLAILVFHFALKVTLFPSFSLIFAQIWICFYLSSDTPIETKMRK